MKHKFNILKYTVIFLFLGQQLIAAEMCSELFNPKTSIINPGLGIIIDKNGQPKAHLKLSHSDRDENASATQALLAKFFNKLITPISSALGVSKLNGFVERLLADNRPIPYKHKLVEALQLKLKFSLKEAQANIPSEGPVVMVGPHISAGVDGMSMASLMTLFRKRDDVLIVLTDRLAPIDGIPENAVLIDDGEPPQTYVNVKGPVNSDVIEQHREVAKKHYENNKKARQRIIDHLRNGGALVIFASGNNATAYPIKSLNAPKTMAKKADYPYDAMWMAGLTTFAQAVPETQIVPVFVSGQLSDKYQYKKANSAGIVSGLMIPKEISNQIGSTVEITIGNKIKAQTVLDIAEQYASDIENNSTEDLTPALVDQVRARGKSIHEIRVSNAFLGYVRAAMYSLRGQQQDGSQEMSPTEWINFLSSRP